MRSVAFALASAALCVVVACDEKLSDPVVRAGGEAGSAGDGAGGSESGGATGSGGSGTGGTTTGSGGASTGGASSGGSSGAGGTTTGAGGARDAGAPDAGNDSTSAGVVGCKDRICSDTEVCCYTPASLLPPVTSSFSCSGKPCTGTEIAVSCDGPEDCDTGKKCCRVDPGLLGTTATTYTCRDSCAVTTIGCGGPDNCGKGEVCCETVLLTASAGTACQKTCNGIGLYTMCRKDADCPTGTTCVESATLPGFRRCQ